MTTKLSFVFIVLFASFGSAESGPAKEAEDFSGKKEMNGYSLKEFSGFEKKWKQVTVRFRKDTQEMRFVYANPKAMEALKAQKKDYPEGAVFAKIGFISEEDPGFVSSVVPSGAKRYQLMVRDKKCKETDGWCYALFNSSGVTFPGNPRDQSMACAACHRLVPDRGFVFSQEVFFGVQKEGAQGKVGTVKPESKDQGKVNQSTLRFKYVDVASLPKDVQLQIPTSYKRISQVDGDISKYLFEGTLNEIKPALVKQARESGAAILIGEDPKMFSLAFKALDNQNCLKGQTAMTTVMTLAPASMKLSWSDTNKERLLRIQTSCQLSELIESPSKNQNTSPSGD